MARRVAVAFFLGICLVTGLAGQPDAATGSHDPAVARDGGTLNAALIQSQPEPRPATAGRPYTLDQNGDGMISRIEAEAHYDWLFSLLDQNQDGAIRHPEFTGMLRLKQPDPAKTRAHLARLDTLFQRLDMDGDRILVRAEFLGACGAHFKTSDADGDGEVSVVEFRSRRPL